MASDHGDLSRTVIPELETWWIDACSEKLHALIQAHMEGGFTLGPEFSMSMWAEIARSIDLELT